MAVFSEHLFEPVEGLRQGLRPPLRLHHPGRRQLLEAQEKPGDLASEPHPADRRSEELAIAISTDSTPGAIGGDQIDLLDLVTEGTGTEMILAVGVGGSDPADCDVEKPGNPSDPPAEGDQPGKEISEAHSRPDANLPGIAVEFDSLAAQETKEGAGTVEGCIAVTTPCASRQPTGSGHFPHQLAEDFRCQLVMKETLPTGDSTPPPEGGRAAGRGRLTLSHRASPAQGTC